jgi:hypothetical protein
VDVDVRQVERLGAELLMIRMCHRVGRQQRYPILRLRSNRGRLRQLLTNSVAMQ